MSDVWQLVLADMEERRRLGIERYGKYVFAGDPGEDWLMHTYMEILDAAVYLRAVIERRDTGWRPSDLIDGSRCDTTDGK